MRQHYILAQESFQNNFFDTEYLKADLKGRSVRGGAITVFAQGCRFVLRMGSTVVLARLLTPADFGLIAMVAAVTNFGVMFKDMGLSMATVQKANINHSQISTLFWINVAVGIVIAGLLAALAPLVAGFYGDPRLTPVTMALAGVFIFGGLTVQHQALLRRHMRFFRLGVVEISAMAAGVAAAIIAGVYGAGYWSLVIMHITMAVVGTIGKWIAFPWLPGRPRRGVGVREMLGFGGNITGFSIVNYFARNLDNVLLGRFCGASVLGLYSKAYNIMMMPIIQIRGPLHAVAMPALSHIQNEPIRYKRYYIKLVTIIAFITMPLMVFLFVCSDEVVRLLLGSQWSGAVNIFKILCIVAFIQPVATTTGLVLISLGQSKRYFTIGIISSTIAVLAFIIGLPWGAIGVAAAYTIATYVFVGPINWYCFRRTPISIKDFFSAISRPAVASLCMGASILPVYSFLSNQPDIHVMSACFIIGILAYLLVLVLIPGGVRMLREFLSLGLLSLRKKANTI